jgi:hypothetical protein
MAATAVYARLSPIQQSGVPGDAYSVSNVSANQTFVLRAGGLYQMSVAATFGGGSVKLQVLGPDGTTYLDCLGADNNALSFSANGEKNTYLAAGSYKLTLG